MNPSELLVCILKSDKDLNTDDAVKQLAKQVLREETDKIVRSERGKPYFPQRQDLFFSVSHSGEYFVCAFAPCEIGIDLQEIKYLRNETPQNAVLRFKKMATRFFHTAEAEYVADETYMRFFKVWTAKEAYVKFTGQGIDKDFSSFCILPEGELSVMDGESVSWQALGAHFTQTNVVSGYYLCICSKEKMKYKIIYF